MAKKNNELKIRYTPKVKNSLYLKENQIIYPIGTVYRIYNKSTGKSLINASGDVKSTLNEIISKLDRGIFYIREIQKMWRKEYYEFEAEDLQHYYDTESGKVILNTWKLFYGGLNSVNLYNIDNSDLDNIFNIQNENKNLLEENQYYAKYSEKILEENNKLKEQIEILNKNFIHMQSYDFKLYNNLSQINEEILKYIQNSPLQVLQMLTSLLAINTAEINKQNLIVNNNIIINNKQIENNNKNFNNFNEENNIISTSEQNSIEEDFIQEQNKIILSNVSTIQSEANDNIKNDIENNTKETDINIINNDEISIKTDINTINENNINKNEISNNDIRDEIDNNILNENTTQSIPEIVKETDIIREDEKINEKTNNEINKETMTIEEIVKSKLKTTPKIKSTRKSKEPKKLLQTTTDGFVFFNGSDTLENWLTKASDWLKIKYPIFANELLQEVNKLMLNKTPSKALQILRDYASGKTYDELIQKFNLNKDLIIRYIDSVQNTAPAIYLSFGCGSKNNNGKIKRVISILKDKGIIDIPSNF